MSLLLSSSFASMQPEPSGPGAAPPSEGAPQPSAPRGDGFAAIQPFVLMAVMFGVFYFLMIRPQQKRQRETDAMLKALRKGDKVRTTSGIRGEIADLTDSEVSLVIADKVKINVLRSHIAGKVDRPAEGKGDDAKT